MPRIVLVQVKRQMLHFKCRQSDFLYRSLLVLRDSVTRYQCVPVTP